MVTGQLAENEITFREYWGLWSDFIDEDIETEDLQDLADRLKNDLRIPKAVKRTAKLDVIDSDKDL